MTLTKYIIREANNTDKKWIVDYITQEWGSGKIVSKGKLYYVKQLKSFVAVEDNDYIGLITYRIEHGECEIISLNSLKENKGIGTALMNSLISKLKEDRIKRVWLITTNNNFSALRFYQKKGFFIKAVYINALETSRKIKPQIPLVDDDGIPIRDEIELELYL